VIGIPTYVTRYYRQGENPFLSLNDLPLSEANKVKRRHCQRDHIGGFYAEDDYLAHRLGIEKWIYHQLIFKGGNPRNTVPVYMTLGDSPCGQFDIRADLQKNAAELRIPIEALDTSAISFTFPDSMYQIILDDAGHIIRGGRTNTPIVYTFAELAYVLNKYENYLSEHYVEAQVWDRDMLRGFVDRQGKQPGMPENAR